MSKSNLKRCSENAMPGSALKKRMCCKTRDFWKFKLHPRHSACNIINGSKIYFSGHTSLGIKSIKNVQQIFICGLTNDCSNISRIMINYEMFAIVTLISFLPTVHTYIYENWANWWQWNKWTIKRSFCLFFCALSVDWLSTYKSELGSNEFVIEHAIFRCSPFYYGFYGH